MIVDIHTHTFPDAIAERALTKLRALSGLNTFLNGTLDDLIKGKFEAGIDCCVIQPVVTNPNHTETVNYSSIEINKYFKDKGIMSFGGIHPDNDDIKGILRRLSSAGVKGIKLHPVYQNVPINDERYYKIIDEACNLDMIVLIHAGLDAGYPKSDLADPYRIKSMIETVHPRKLVLAHMGGHSHWEDVFDVVAGEDDVYLDTAICLPYISEDMFKHLIDCVGEDHILFGSDSPWTSQTESIRLIKALELPQMTEKRIMGQNAAELLNL